MTPHKASRVGLCVLLALTVLPLFSTPTVTSQQYTTYRILQSITTQVTSYGNNEFTVGQTTVTTTEMQEPVNIYSGTFTMTAISTKYYGCDDEYSPFTGNLGQYVSGSFSSSYPISIYVVTDADYRNWLSTGSCDNPPTSIATVENQRQATFHGTLTETGNWDVIYVLQRSGGKSATVNVDVNLSNGSTVYTQTNPIVSFTYYTSVIQVAHTLTSTSVAVLPVLAGNNIVVLIIVLGAMTALVFLVVRSRRHASSIKPTKSTKSAKKDDSKREKAASAKNFCIECGSELPLKSKFCNRCGTKQP